MDRKEAIKVVKNNFPDDRIMLSEALMTLIPELKESEDEQNRKWILEYLYDGLRKSDEQFKEEFKCAIDWLEKQGEQKSKDKYTFNSIPRLLDMIKPTDRAKGYCQKLIDSLQQEGYVTDAKIISEHLKLMNGEEVVMTTMDGKHGELIDKPSDEQMQTLHTQLNEEEIQLLIKDLSARLPYNVKLKIKATWSNVDEFASDVKMHVLNTSILNCVLDNKNVEEVKPYLRSMSSMTDEERTQFLDTCIYVRSELCYEWTCDSYDWLNEHNFDYRGLIEKGLAIEAPEGMYN